jgi:hypothetical protein
MIPDLGLASGDGLVLLIGVVLALAHALLLVRWRAAAMRGSTSTETSPAAVADAPEQLPDPDCDRPAQCPHCGATNQPEYRLCRNCVGELGNERSVTASESSVQSRGLF